MVVCRRAVKQVQEDLDLGAQASGEAPKLFVAGTPAAGGPVFLPRRHPSALAERLLDELSSAGVADRSVTV